jgi:hypothetical protein
MKQKLVLVTTIMLQAHIYHNRQWQIFKNMQRGHVTEALFLPSIYSKILHTY